MRTSDLRPTRGGGEWGGALPDLRPTGGARARARNTPRTYDRQGYLKKEDKYASGLMLRRTPDRALKNRTVRPKSP